jgi:hypothetical protein
MIIYLYIKEHASTGLRYFGKTTKKNPFNYNGSGYYWKKHIKKHGTNKIKTIDVWGFDDINLCTQFALKFSHDNNIVESKDWANLKPENGLDGAIAGCQGPNKGKNLSEETKAKLRNNSGWHHTQSAKDAISIANRNKKLSSETIAKVKANHAKPFLGKKFTDDHKKQLSKSKLGKSMSKTVSCLVCMKSLTKSEYTRYHLNH